MELKKGMTSEISQQQQQITSQGTMLVNSIAQVISINQPSLSIIKKDKGEVYATALLVSLITKAVAFFSVGRGMNDFQIKETAELILKNYYWLKSADFQLFFDKLKLGHYGKSYDRMDGSVILVALAEYSEERIEIASKISEDLHKESKSENDLNEYFIKIGKYYIRETEDGFEEVESKELATSFSFISGQKTMKMLIKSGGVDLNELRLVNVNKAGSFLDYIATEAPLLLTKKESYRRATENYYTSKKSIESDETLSDFEKYNKISRLAGLNEVSESDFIEIMNIQKGIKINS